MNEIQLLDLVVACTYLLLSFNVPTNGYEKDESGLFQIQLNEYLNMLSTLLGV
jgi:hypothetical protein